MFHLLFHRVYTHSFLALLQVWLSKKKIVHPVMLLSFGGWCGTCRLWGLFGSSSYNWPDLEGTIEVLLLSPLLSDYWMPQGDQFACSIHTSHDRRPYHTLYPKSNGMRSLWCVTMQTFPRHKLS